MEPGVPPTRDIPKDEPTRGAGPLIFHSPFDVVTEDASAALVQQAPARPVLWDVAVRRFSSPAYDANRQRLTKHIDHARTAYARAFVAIQKSVKDVDAEAILSRSSANDVAQTAMELLNSPGSTNDDEGRVSRFIDMLHHYQGVFDVLSQAGDFGYLAVIWGGMKLLLMMAKNKKDFLTKVTDKLTELGLTLSRIEVYAKLYPTARMIELISMLYAAVADFLEAVIVQFKRQSGLRKVLSAISPFILPFEEKFGRAMARINVLESCISKDAILLHAMQTASMAEHQLDSYLHRTHLAATLTAATPQPNPLGPPAPSSAFPDIFLEIKKTLFLGLEDQAAYHEALAATYSVTARAWEEWFSVEQEHLPSAANLPPTPPGTPPRSSTTTPGPSGSSSTAVSRLSRGLCDAPDHQHALQWFAQQRRLTPHIPSAYLIWAADMTVHTAIASLIFQVLQQRPAAVVELNLDMAMFARASASVRALWDVFTLLMKKLGGCLLYLVIGSAGDDEFEIVKKFVHTVNTWDGPAIWVTIIHPWNEGFGGLSEATDLDGLYDVHPSLTTTDALHHVLMVELGIHEVSKTILDVLWEAVWRETRYAAVGVAFTRVVEMVESVADELANAEKGLSEKARALWMEGVRKWVNHPVASNCTRELVQRHLDIVDLALPDDIRAALGALLKRLVLRIDSSKADDFASRSMTQTQRSAVWEKMKAAILPGIETMFCTPIRDLVADALECYAEVPPQNARQAGSVVIRLLNDRFGMEGDFKSAMSLDEQLISKGITQAVMTGFADTIAALSEPEEVLVEESEEVAVEELSE